jgi:membrane-associated phospholipid phosphatase
MYNVILGVSLGTAAIVLAQHPHGGGVQLGPPQAPSTVQAFRPVDAPARRDVVLLWNETALNAIRADRTAPPLAARNLAIMHAAVFDAANALTRTHRPYFVEVTVNGGESSEAAAAVAAHRTLVTLFPQQVGIFDAALDAALDPLPDGPAKRDGILLGQYVAEKMLALRARDGADARVAYRPPAGPGQWQPTPPDYRAALLPQWPSLTCFCMKSGSQFRAPGAPALGSRAYWTAYQEVKALGGARSLVRTPEQTQIAMFWKDGDGTATPPGHWNQIAQVVAETRGLSLSDNARLFALLNLALADAGIMAWDCKYHFNYWRPIQAVRSSPVTADPATSGDPNWTPLIDTPPFASYTSGHSSFSGAGAGALANFFGSDNVAFTSRSDGLPGVTRSFQSFWQAAQEAGKSRIYGGIHWEFDNADGLATGRALADYVTQNYLTPRTTLSAYERLPASTATQR